MRSVALLFAAGAALYAHVVSTSSGELRMEGSTAAFELRIPAYEVEHVSNPETALLDEIWFKDARRTAGACTTESDDYVCRASYEFETPTGDSLEAQVTLFRATVPNHIHLLTATNGNNTAQEIFDQVTPLRELRFRPPSFLTQLGRDARAGAARLLTSVPAVLFLVALALIVRTKREAAGLAMAFIAGEWLVRPISALLPSGFSPEFLEATLALTVAYLAAEILWLPDSRARWSIVPLLGLIHGLPFAPYPPGYLAGAATVQVIVLAALTFVTLTFVTWDALRKRLAVGLLIAGLAWFARVMFF